ncbi:MAG TPA: hypothetical protein VHY84_14900 [Bryobacteraceae bacterium]|jgi:hypothetical protein|nr:hypothetical protein [Bryobacteraceae bacterium]
MTRLFVSSHFGHEGIKRSGALLGELLEASMQQLVFAVERPDRIEESEAGEYEKRGREAVTF